MHSKAMSFPMSLFLLPLFACWEDLQAVGVTEETADTSGVLAASGGLDLEGVVWSYSGTIPDESSAGVTCSEEECQRCFLLEGGALDLYWRASDADPWLSVRYGTYAPVPGDAPAYRVDGPEHGVSKWLPVAEQGLPAVGAGYVVVTDLLRPGDYTTLAISACDDVTAG